MSTDQATQPLRTTLPPRSYRLSVTPRILVLSPHKGKASAIARFLAKRGCSPTYTVSEGRARAQLQANVFDLLLIDASDEQYQWSPHSLGDDSSPPTLVLRPPSSRWTWPATPGVPRPYMLTQPVAWEIVYRTIISILEDRHDRPHRQEPVPWSSEPREGQPSTVKDLSPRELEVLQLLVHGGSNKAIADELRLSEPTVKKHVQRIIAKFQATDRTHAAVTAIRAGIVC